MFQTLKKKTILENSFLPRNMRNEIKTLTNMQLIIKKKTVVE